MWTCNACGFTTNRDGSSYCFKCGTKASRPTTQSAPHLTASRARSPITIPTAQKRPPSAPYGQSSPSQPIAPVGDLELRELARQYRAAKSTRYWTLWVGLFCLWPVWIVAYIEHMKMQSILSKVAAKGIDAEVWARGA